LIKPPKTKVVTSEKAFSEVALFFSLWWSSEAPKSIDGRDMGCPIPFYLLYGEN